MNNTLSNTDLSKIANSGQCFRWYKANNNFFVPVNNTILNLSEATNIGDKTSDTPFTNTYLDLNTDYSKILSALYEETPFSLHPLYNYSSGIRILNQPFFETCISFIVSQNNNIPRIKNIIKNVCGSATSPFPTAEELLTKIQSRDYRLGYRQKYLEEFCMKYIDGELSDLEKLSPIYSFYYPNATPTPRPDLSDVIDNLCSFKGIGPKVASCITLFSLGYKNSIPRDVWIKRAEERYNIIWHKEYAGYQQQLIFYAMQNNR